jgi:hypothetical protein
LAFHSGREADHSPPSSAEAWCSVRGENRVMDWTLLTLDKYQ